MKIQITTESIRKAIKSVSLRSRTLQNDIQQVAEAILEHISLHGDWRLAVEAIEGISASKGVKASKLTQYFEAMMCASYTKSEDGETHSFVYDEGKSHKDISLDMARSVKWYDFKAPTKDNTKTLEEMREAVAKMLAASFKKDKVTEEDTAELLAAFDRQIEIHNLSNVVALDAVA